MQKIKFINFHSSDYANYLSNKPRNKSIKKNYIVFLDIKAQHFQEMIYYLIIKLNMM